MNGEVMENKAGASVNHRDWTDYANILIDNSVNKKYTTTLYFKGENTVAGIFQKEYDHTELTLGTLEIRGVPDSENNPGKVNLGSAWGNMYIHAYDLSIGEYDNDTHEKDDFSEYMFWTTNGEIHHAHLEFIRCNIQAQNKRFYCFYDYILFKNTKADIGSIRHYSRVEL